MMPSLGALSKDAAGHLYMQRFPERPPISMVTLVLGISITGLRGCEADQFGGGPEGETIIDEEEGGGARATEARR